jgi:KDO2-lipid IV(A) lauroyltransferase
LADRCLAENCISFLEIFYTRRADMRFVHERVEITETTRRSMEIMADKSRAVVVCAAHLGSWELLVGFTHLFPGRPRQVVVRRSKQASVNEVIRHLRGQFGVDIVEHRNAAGAVLRSLRKGGITAFLVDHNCSRDEAVFLPFLGEVAAVNMGPALLALRAKALVFPACLLRLGDGRYRLHIEAPLDCATLTGDRNANVTAVARFYTQAVERFIRMAPEQWFWMHNRWKTRPASENKDHGIAGAADPAGRADADG